MSEVERIIKLETQYEALQKDTDEILGHVKVMNSEQGMQAVEIAELGVNMKYIQGQNWFIITVVLAAVITYFVQKSKGKQ